MTRRRMRMNIISRSIRNELIAQGKLTKVIRRAVDSMTAPTPKPTIPEKHDTDPSAVRRIKEKTPRGKGSNTMKSEVKPTKEKNLKKKNPDNNLSAKDNPMIKKEKTGKKSSNRLWKNVKPTQQTEEKQS